MDVVAYLPADPRAAEPVQVSERALDAPVLGAESGAVFGAATGDQWLHAEGPVQTAVCVVVVAAVSEDHVRAAPAPGPGALAPHRRHGLQERDRLGDVAAVATGQGGSERDAGHVSDQMMLAARPAPVNRASSGPGSPFDARMREPSAAAREKFRAFASHGFDRAARLPGSSVLE
ncbi:hypothetical protein GCM10010421_08930 [Streptomyces glaucus]|uniref:Secreted protein n=1 Tax=Streptomyces glaucus TaxID=284029 RepID=A0ABN3J9N8_9ACTN